MAPKFFSRSITRYEIFTIYFAEFACLKFGLIELSLFDQVLATIVFVVTYLLQAMPDYSCLFYIYRILLLAGPP